MKTLLNQALKYYDKGFAVVPIARGGKNPIIDEWQTRRLSRDEVEREFSNGHNPGGIGAITGQLSGNRVNLDFDGPNWQAAFEHFLHSWDSFRNAPISKTGSGKRHIWILIPDLPETFTNKKFHREVTGYDDKGKPIYAQTIELRGNASNNLLPPSLHPSGNRYEWISDEAEWIEVPFQELYTWLAEWSDSEKRSANPAPAPTTTGQYGELPRRTLEFIAFKTPEGDRNEELYYAAQQCRASGRPLEIALEALLPAAIKNGTPEKEAIATIKSGYNGAEKAGMKPLDLITEDASDEGNAQCLLKLYPGKFLYCPEFGKPGWLYYNGQYWQTEHAEGTLERHIVEMIIERHNQAVALGVDDKGRWIKESHVKFCVPNFYRIKGCKDNFRSLVEAGISEFDTNPDLLNCQNGVVDLRTGELTEHNPAQRFTYVIPVDYKPDADYSEWHNWLLETVGDDSEVVSYLQQAIGYSLSGRTYEECLFYVHGPTRSGKGTFTETILKLLPPPLSTGVDFATFTAKRDHDSQNFDLAGLKAARLIVASESNKYQVLNPRRIKAVTGGDAIRCAHKHGAFFSYFPQFKIWLVSNEPLRADAEDDAIWARVNVITFPNSHLGKEDKSLKRRFLERGNLEAVLAWAVVGAGAWYGSLPTGLQKPAAIVKETQRHRDENDFSARFIEECTEKADGHFLPNPVLKAVYQKWCDEQSLTPKVRHLTGRMDVLYLRDRGYQKYEDLQLYGYHKVIKPWGDGIKQFRGYYGVMIPQGILDEYA